MSETKFNNGGPAFPLTYDLRNQPESATHDGMSLRDWFAGQLVAGLLASEYGSAWNPRGVAQNAYDIADAMLAEREKRGER